jgi:hypothetical protein
MFALILRWLGCLLLEAPLQFLSYPLVPILVLFEDGGHLPAMWWWFETFDNSLYGDVSWQKKHPNYKSWWCMTQWLWRNSLGGFSYRVTGAIPELPPIKCSGDFQTGNRPGHSGWYWVHCSNCWMFYYVRQCGQSKTCLRVILGWKLFSIKPSSIIWQRVQTVLGCNPLMGFEPETYKE